jgi:RimJ/RimL family protein N-acetyltransferase
MIRIFLHPDAHAFLERAEPWLERAEIEHAMTLQSGRFARNDASHFQKPLYWATVEEEGQIVGCAFRTPPYRLGITALPPAAIPALVESVAAVYRTLSGVAGPEPAASAFTAAWTKLRGGSWSVQSRQSLLTHKAIVPTRDPPPGTLRLATGADGALAQRWGAEFAYDSGIAGLDGGLCARLIDLRQLYFWDDGAPRCMIGVLRETRDAAAIGVLYTPAALRERGYATAAVAAFSRQLLDRGLRHSYFCLEPSNPAGAWICRRLGYAVVQETVDIDFVFESRA